MSFSPGVRALARRLRQTALVSVGAAVVVGGLMPAAARQQPRLGRLTLAAASRDQIREASSVVDSMRRSGELRLRTSREDPQMRGRTHQRLDQFYRGVRVFGADVAQQLVGGEIVSVYGNVYDNIEVDPAPSIDAARARAIVEAIAGTEIGYQPELMVLPRDDGAYTLTWRIGAVTARDVREYFVDAQSGAIAFDYSNLQTQSAVGRGTGVLGDTKKISVSASGGQFATTDRLRPPSAPTTCAATSPVRCGISTT